MFKKRKKLIRLQNELKSTNRLLQVARLNGNQTLVDEYVRQMEYIFERIKELTVTAPT